MENTDHALIPWRLNDIIMEKILSKKGNPAWQIMINKVLFRSKGNDCFKYELGASNSMDCRLLMQASNDNVAWN